MKVVAEPKIATAYGTFHSAPQGRNEHSFGDAHHSANVSE